MTGPDTGTGLDAPRGAGPQVPLWLRTAGVTSWLILGVAGAIALGTVLFALTRGVTIPLLVAVVLGAIFVGLVDGLEKLRVPRWLGSLIVMAAVLGLAIGIFAVVISGITDHADEIGRQLRAGVARIEEGLASLGVGETLPSKIEEQVARSPDFLSGGAMGVIIGGLSSAASFLVSAFVALNILFFILKDAHAISGWLQARSSGVVATTLLGDSARTMRSYFRGKTLVGAASAVTVFLGTLALGVPLPASIALVTFFTSFIPYIGAIVAGAYAVLLALGSGGVPSALAVLAVVVLANAVVETLVTPLAIGGQLRLHPLVVLIVTILGGIVAGLIGVTLAAPATAVAVDIVGKLRAAGVFDRPQPLQEARPASG